MNGKEVEKKCAPDRNYCDDYSKVAPPDEDHCKKAPPDGGYGWVIVLLACLSNMLRLGMHGVYVVMYADLVDYFQASTSKIGWIMSTHSLTSTLTMPVTSWLLSRYDTRPVAVGGAVVTALGMALSPLSDSVTGLLVTYGIIGGCGSGLLCLAASTIVFDYFKVKRPLAVGLALIGNGLSFVVAGPLSRWMLDIYGWRGTMLLASGILMHAIPICMLFRPLNRKRKTTSSYKAASAQTEVEVSMVTTNKKKSDIKKKCLQSLESSMALSVICRVEVVLYLVASGIAFFANTAFLIHLSNKATSNGIEKYEAALLPAIYGICNASGRVGAGCIANLPCVNILLEYTCCLLVAGGAAVLAGIGNTFLQMAPAAAIFGLFLGAVLGIMTTIMAELVGDDHVTQGISGLWLFAGVPSIMGAPLAGYLYDVTGDYSIPYIVAGSVLGLAALITILLTWMRNVRSRHTEPDISMETEYISIMKNKMPITSMIRSGIIEASTSPRNRAFTISSLHSVASLQ